MCNTFNKLYNFAGSLPPFCPHFPLFIPLSFSFKNISGGRDNVPFAPLNAPLTQIFVKLRCPLFPYMISAQTRGGKRRRKGRRKRERRSD